MLNYDKCHKFFVKDKLNHVYADIIITLKTKHIFVDPKNVKASMIFFP